MSIVKILHCADIHIGASESFLGAMAESRRKETLLTFERIVDLAEKSEVDVLAIAGDLFDSNTIEKSFIDAVFNKIASIPNIKVIFAAGNHDPLNPQSPFIKYDTPENLFVLGINDSVVYFDSLNLKVYGRSFETVYLKGKETFEKNVDDSTINLMVQHGELKSDLNSKYNSITKNFITHSRMDYIALGHVHAKTEIGKLGDTYFAYCGCPEGQGFDELDIKGVYLGEIGKGVCNLEFIPISKRCHIFENVDISGISADEIFECILKQLENNYGEGFHNNLYKIELVGTCDFENGVDIADLTARLSDKVYFVKIKDNTTPAIDLETLSREQSLRGIFVRQMLEKIKQADEAAAKKYKYALNLGLKAFSSEVKFDEN